MKLGFQPDIDHTLSEAFRFAGENNFGHVELLLDHPSFYHEKIAPEEVTELSNSYDVEVLIHASAINTNFISISSEMRRASYREIEKTVLFAEKCDAKLVTVHIGWNPGFITARGFVFREEWYDRHNEKVLTEEFLPFIRENEIVAIENTINISGGIMRALERIIEETEAKLTFDIGHFSVKGGHELFLENFDRVENVHLHDNRKEYDEHLQLGKGEIDFELIPKDYDRYLTLELRDEDAILRSRDFIMESGLWM